MHLSHFAKQLAFFLALTVAAKAQIVTTQPAFPTLDDLVTITYDATQGSGGLINLADTVYGHFGLVTAGPTSTAWTRVQGAWGTRDARTRMTKTGPNLWAITFVPRTYFANVPATTQAYRLAMVFRNANGSMEGKTDAGGDIFTPLYQPGVDYVRFSRPAIKSAQANIGAAFSILVESSAPAALSVLDNGLAVAQLVNTKALNYIYPAASAGNHTLVAKAEFASGSVIYDSISVVVVGKPKTSALPAGYKDGPNYISPTSAVLVLAAPGKKNVFVKGDFNNWQVDTGYYMRRTPDSTRFWLQIDNLVAGREYAYQFLIDGVVTIGDPLCEKITDQNDQFINKDVYPNLAPYPAGKALGSAAVLQPGRAPYVWRHPKVQIPKERMVIYELHLRDFLSAAKDKSYKGLTDSLQYLKKLGVTTVQLMPISEFDGNDSWGYNPMYHGAVDKAYGSQDAFRALIDSIHGQGMQIIIDVVYNHAWGSSPLSSMYPLSASPYLNPVSKHDFNVGNDMNHESIYTQAYMDRCNERWLKDYNIDGFRFDLSKGLTQKNTLGNTGAWGQKDPSRIRLLARMGTVCRSYDPNAILILEHFADNAEERVLSDSLGFMLWGNMSGAGSDVVEGNGGDLYGGYFGGRGWQNPNLVTFTESHDEERNIYNARNFGASVGGYSARNLATALDRAKALATIQMAQPGPKMLWQFQELGYDFSINRCQNGTISGDCRTYPKPSAFAQNYHKDQARSNLYKVFAALNMLRSKHAVFSSRNNTLVLNGVAQKRVTLRGGADGDVTVLANFGLAPANQFAGFTTTGTWYEFWTGDSITITNTNLQLELKPGECRIYSTKKLGEVQKGLILETAHALPKGKAQTYRLLPNPAQTRFYVEGPAGTLHCTLRSLDGRVISNQELPDNSRTFALDALPAGKPTPGIYLLQIDNKGAAPSHMRLVVE